MTTLRIQETEVPFKIKKNPRAKHLSLRISHDGILSITIPKWAREHQGIKFAEQKSDWILKHLKKIPKKTSRPIKNNSTLPFFGPDNILLQISKKNNKRASYTFMKPDTPLTLPQIQIDLPDGHPNPQQLLQQLIKDFYIETARAHLTARTTHFAKLLNLSYNQIRLKDTSSRWGSCSQKKNLNYNYRIILAPRPIIDYLVIHEVCHLRHLDHSPKFWNLVESLMPDYSIHQKWLRENGNTLKLPNIQG